MHIDRLSRFESPDYPVLSVYVNREPLHESVRARLSDLLKPLRSLSNLDHDAQMSLRSDLDSVIGLADRIDVDRSPATAVFACDGGGLFEYIPLSTPVWDVAFAADRPYLRPLRSIRQRDSVVVAVVDRRHAWLYGGGGGSMRLLELIEESESHKGNFGGFSGYEEKGARNHADFLDRRHFRYVADRLFELQRKLGFGKLVVGGHEETSVRFESFLHPYLRARLLGSFVIDPHTMSDSDIADRANVFLLDASYEAEEALASRVSVTSEEGGRAVVGLKDVLNAVNNGAVDRLVVAGRFTRPGVMCGTCGWLERSGESCMACGSGMVVLGDVIDAAMEQVLRRGGQADQISVSSPLDAHGVGALLRFSVRVA